MKLHTLVLTAVIVSAPAYAESLKISCPLVRQYSESQVNLLLNQARSVIGDQEVGRIYNKYVGLKNECLVNGNAFRVVPVTAAMRDWLAQNGVDMKAASRL